MAGKKFSIPNAAQASAAQKLAEKSGVEQPPEKKHTHKRSIEDLSVDAYERPTETRTARTILMLRPTIKKALKELADERNTSINELVTQAIDEWLERNYK